MYTHPGVVHVLRNSPAFVLSGRESAIEAGACVDLGDIDGYVRDSDMGALVAATLSSPNVYASNVRFHVVEDAHWPFVEGQKFASLWVAWLDLEDRQDRAANSLLTLLGLSTPTHSGKGGQIGAG